MAYGADFLGDTGQGAVIVLKSVNESAGAGCAASDPQICMGCPRSIQLPELTMESIDTTCLDSTGFMRRIPADVADPGTIEATFVFDAALDGPNSLFADGQQLCVTIILPESRGSTTAPATLTGTGFISSLGLPSLETSTLMEISLTIQMDGGTGPTLTVETPDLTQTICPDP